MGRGGCLPFSPRAQEGQNRRVTLKIVIDQEAASAPYEQLRAQIAERARAGVLPVGYKLPTVRGLAEELGLAANTVAKAYRALEADGVIETRGRNGTFVAAAGDAAERRARRPPGRTQRRRGAWASAAKRHRRRCRTRCERCTATDSCYLSPDSG